MDYSYIGSGQGYIRKVGAAAPMQDIGNASAISFGVTEDVKSILDRTKPGGGTRNENRRISSVDFSCTLSDYSPNNLALGFFGTTSDIAAGTANREPVTVYPGGLNTLARFADTITSVKSTDGATTYAAGSDYVLTDGGIVIPSGSTILTVGNTSAIVEVTYAYGAKTIMQALMNAAGEYEFYFPGYNEARESKRMIIRAWRVRLGATDQIALVTDDFGNMTIKGTVLKDDTQPAGISQYFSAEIQI